MVKDFIESENRQARDWDKMFTKHIPDNALDGYSLYEELTKFKSKNTVRNQGHSTEIKELAWHGLTLV